LNTYLYWWYLLFFFPDVKSPWYLGPGFFLFQTFNAIGIFRSLFDDEWTDNIAFFKSFFSIAFFSYHISTFFAFFCQLAVAYRREIERTCAFFFLKMDTSPEARTVLSKFSILFEVFWLDRIHTWTRGCLKRADWVLRLTRNRMEFLAPKKAK
jgi:hypothetical protein